MVSHYYLLGLLRFKINHNLRPKEKKITLGYPVMKEGKKKEENDEKVQRIEVQRPMKGKGFKFHKVKERPSRLKSVSQKKPNKGNWAGIPENARARGSLGCITQPKLDHKG